MGRHTAPIPIVRPGGSTPPATGPITDPRLLDGATAAGPGQGPAAPQHRTAPRRQDARVARIDGPAIDEEGIDEIPVRSTPRSVRAVRAAEDAAAAEELPPPPFPRVRDLVFAGVSLIVLAVAIGTALAP